MNRTPVFSLVFLLPFVLQCRTAADLGKLERAAFAKEGYHLVWADEFNRNGRPDSANWQYESGFVRNEEDQWYQAENAWCENGSLVIEARKESRPSAGFIANSADWRKRRDTIHYTSASLNTRNKRSWLYGRLVMRGRIDVQEGVWPAWWTLGIAGRWPANGEIDIMEFYRNKLLANIACLGSNSKPEWYSRTFSMDSLGGKDWSSRFHTWRMDWDQESISLYVDDQLLNKVPLALLENKDGSGKHPFRQPHYLLLNLALGGQNGGRLERTVFPNRFEVDYVRVYQKE